MTVTSKLRAASVPALFAATLFLSSFLLFMVQPMQGKVLLPLLGGTPAVWNTCMVFFQAALLLGYLYSHNVATRLAPRRQVVLHLAAIVLPLAVLPPALPQAIVQSPLLSSSPILWVIMALALSSGPAFLAVSTTSPLLQDWFSRIGQKRSADPYVLYAAGNCGSLLALVAYPFIVEPRLRLDEQFRFWTWGYGLLVALVAATALVLLKRGGAHAGAASATASTEADAEPADAALAPEPIGLSDDDAIDAWLSPTAAQRALGGRLGERLRWIALAFVPSSLMLGVTTFMTTDIAAVPMLWLLPLTLYMLSFVLVFSRYTLRADRIFTRLLPLMMVTTLLLVFTEYRSNMWAVISLHLAGFFVAAMTCHGRLALGRPEPRRLTEFYFCMSLGGVLGGAFNSLLAPNVFTSIAEYPLLMAACVALCRPRAGGAEAAARTRELIWCGAALAAGALAMRGTEVMYQKETLEPLAELLSQHWEKAVTRTTAAYAIPLVLLLIAFYKRPLRLGVGLLGLVVVALAVDLDATILHRERSFFGVLTVKRYDYFSVNALVNGGILHGEQRMDPPEERANPRSYYHREGPLGQIIEVVQKRKEHPEIAGIGLGAGTLAAYGEQNNSITFFELDPHVEQLARNPKYFTYVDDCIKRWCNLKVKLGDGRLGMLRSEQAFDLIVVDAFSSDAIPVHLLTTEALYTYLEKLNEGGVIAFHISNRYIDLEPVILNLAKEYGLGYGVRSDDDDEAIGKGASTWVVVARESGAFDTITADDRWRGLEDKEGIGLWADDYANVTRAFTWF